MKHKEDDLQAACIKWIRYAYPGVICFSVPNGGSRNAIEAAKLKRTGTLAGVADLFIMQGGRMGVYNGLFIELKVGKNQQTTSQKEFEDNANLAHYKYRVCRTIDEFMQVVKGYLE